MRHRKRGRTLGRSPSHRKAMLRNLASSLFLTERDAEFDDNAPKAKGRVITTLPKAKEVRPLVEKCITIARKSMEAEGDAQQYATDADRGSETWKSWRQSDEWQMWNHAMAPAVTARRRALRMLGNKEAVRILFEDVAPRMADRDGGYTRILRLAEPRLGDAGARAIIEFVGNNDRVKQESEKPSFEEEGPTISDLEDSEEEPPLDLDTKDSEATDETDIGDESAQETVDDADADDFGKTRM